MTDINLAYSYNNMEEDEYKKDEKENEEIYNKSKQEQHNIIELQKQRELQLKAQAQAQEQKNNNQYYYQYQQQQPQQQQHIQRHPEYSFWDRMIMSKREVLKLFILSIVIILGISIEKVGFYYISLYLNSTDLSSFQEFLVRISFPLIVFLLLWIIKSL